MLAEALPLRREIRKVFGDRINAGEIHAYLQAHIARAKHCQCGVVCDIVANEHGRCKPLLVALEP